MDAREKRPLAPLRLAGTGRERAAQCEAFRGELRQGSVDLPARQRERFGDRAGSDRAESFETAAHDFHQRFLARPLVSGEFFRRFDRRRT